MKGLVRLLSGAGVAWHVQGSRSHLLDLNFPPHHHLLSGGCMAPWAPEVLTMILFFPISPGNHELPFVRCHGGEKCGNILGMWV